MTGGDIQNARSLNQTSNLKTISNKEVTLRCKNVQPSHWDKCAVSITQGVNAFMNVVFTELRATVGFPCTIPGNSRNGWETWSGRNGPRPVSLCFASITSRISTLTEQAKVWNFEKMLFPPYFRTTTTHKKEKERLVCDHSYVKSIFKSGRRWMETAAAAFGKSCCVTFSLTKASVNTRSKKLKVRAQFTFYCWNDVVITC